MAPISKPATLFLNVPKANSAEEIKITYSIFSRTIKVNSLKTFAKEGKSTKKLRRILRATGSPDKEIRTVLKDLIYKELDEIQEHLDSLETKQRIELVIKLIPYVLPKVDSISHSANEPLDWGI